MDNQKIQLESAFNLIDISEIGWKEKGIIMWEWFWRGLIVTIIATILAMLLSWLTGGILGIIMMIIFRMHPEDYTLFLKTVGWVIGILAGFLSLYPLILWLTKSRIGKYRFGIFIS